MESMEDPYTVTVFQKQLFCGASRMSFTHSLDSFWGFERGNPPK